jgi:hypothetical protein
VSAAACTVPLLVPLFILKTELVGGCIPDGPHNSFHSAADARICAPLA